MAELYGVGVFIVLILSITLCLIGYVCLSDDFRFYLLDMNVSRKRHVVKVVVILLVLEFVFLMFIPLTADTYNVNERYDIYQTDAPFGRYWVQTEGVVCFLAGLIVTSLAVHSLSN